MCVGFVSLNVSVLSMMLCVVPRGGAGLYIVRVGSASVYSFPNFFYLIATD